MATWRREWLKPEGTFASFGERFTAAKKDFGWLMDSSRMHPSSGVIKLLEKEPATVEHLFMDVLFAENNGNVGAIQEHMDTFIDEYEGLRQKKFSSGTGRINRIGILLLFSLPCMNLNSTLCTRAVRRPPWLNI